MKISENGANLKLKDYQSYLACGFAPKAAQENLFALFSFRQELIIAASAAEPMIGKIKLQWWREVLAEIAEGKPCRPHPALLVLKNFPEHFPKFYGAIDEYEKILDGFQPKTFTEITAFILATNGNIFAVAAKILGTEYNENLALAFGYSEIARKLKQNSANNPQEIIARLAARAWEILPNSRAAFAIICRHNLENLEKRRGFLLLKLLIKGNGVI